MTKRRRSRRWLHVTNAAAALSLTAALVVTSVPAPVEHVDVQPAGVTVGVGPLGDGFGILPPIFLNLGTVPPGDTYLPVVYSALVFGVDMPLGRFPYVPVAYDRTIAAGSAALRKTLSTIEPGERTRVVGMSLGAIVVDSVRVDLPKTDTSPDLSFLLIGNPLRPDGGFMTRFGSFTIPILHFTFGRGASDGDFPTTDLTYEYDFMSDFPTYFNPLAIANAVSGLVFTHIFPGYVFANPDDPDAVRTTVGNTTYVRLPTELPLLFPVRAVTTLFGVQRIADALDALLRPIVDAGYDRTGDPSVVRQFEWHTPQEKIDEAKAKLPAAFHQAMSILFGLPSTTKHTDDAEKAAPEAAVPDETTPQPSSTDDDHDAEAADDVAEPTAQAETETDDGTAPAGAGSSDADDTADPADDDEHTSESDDADDAQTPAEPSEPAEPTERSKAKDSDADERDASESDSASEKSTPADKPADSAAGDAAA
ncbi:MAG: PE-PPE domain-containing protein [Mycobacterium sp.]|nr:PE-PPE domain-containing protein [Mycobacterium sp.]